MKSVFEFIDYRQFLKHFYEERKAETSYFSHRYFCQKAGINSSSFLKHVIEGRRSLTPSACEKFCMALGLVGKEQTYFRHLVFFNQASTAAEKQEHYSILRSLNVNVRENVLNAAQYDYFANWYTAVVRELVCAIDFGSDFGVLGRAVQPPIRAVEARRAVRLLEKMDLIRRRDDGRYEQTATAITADDSVTTMAQRKYVATMMQQAGVAVEVYNKWERHTSTMTIGISPATYDVLAAEIEAFKDRVKTIVNQDARTTRVYQFNLALFPVSVEISGVNRTSGEVRS
jgi:uncharacterized protein (TIGR02147 family)